MFETFDDVIVPKAKQADSLAAQCARLTRQLRKGADRADLHLLRQRVADAAKRAAETAKTLELLSETLVGFTLAADIPEPANTDSRSAEYGERFERACVGMGVRLDGSYPDYRVFPFDVRLRPSEERVWIGRKAFWSLRPEIVANAVKRERDRLWGATFDADKFGAALARAFDVLILERRARSGASSQQVALRDVLALLQLPTFGRASYTRDEFAFDIFRYRQTPMSVGSRHVMLEDMRGVGAGFQIPNARGGWEPVTGLRVTAAEDIGNV